MIDIDGYKFILFSIKQNDPYRNNVIGVYNRNIWTVHLDVNKEWIGWYGF